MPGSFNEEAITSAKALELQLNAKRRSLYRARTAIETEVKTISGFCAAQNHTKNALAKLTAALVALEKCQSDLIKCMEELEQF
jgi:hypothetical protein